MTRPGLDWLVLATHVPPEGQLSGVVRYTTELISGLERHGDVRVHVVGTAAARAALTDLVGDRARVHVAPAVPAALLPLHERYGRLPAGRFDVVHGVKHLVPRRSGALSVLTAHDMTLLDRPEDFGTLKRRLLPRPYLASLRSADLVLCVSRATERRVLSYVPQAQGRTAAVPLAAPRELTASVAEPVPALAGSRFALVVGDSSPRKNVGTVVDAWPLVREAVPDAVLAVAGPPSWGRTERGRAWDALVAQGAVVPAGRVSDAQLRWCYENAAVVLCPSLSEGFGLPAAEALELGARVVISDDPALEEVAAGRAAAVVPALDVGGWVRACTRGLQQEQGPPAAGGVSRARSWADVVDETVAAVVALRSAALR